MTHSRKKFFGPSDPKNLAFETCRALDCLSNWIAQGNSIEDAMEKVKSSYGFVVFQCVLHALKNHLKKPA